MVLFMRTTMATSPQKTCYMNRDDVKEDPTVYYNDKRGARGALK
jgi:hypothetical protein